MFYYQPEGSFLSPSALFSLLDSYMVFTVTFGCYLQSSFCVEDQVGRSIY